MTKEATSKTDSGLVKAPERSTVALCNGLQREPLKQGRCGFLMYQSTQLRHVLRWVEKNSCDGSIKHDLSRNANTTRIMYLYKAA